MLSVCFSQGGLASASRLLKNERNSFAEEASEVKTFVLVRKYARIRTQPYTRAHTK